MRILFLGSSKRYELLTKFSKYGELFSLEKRNDFHSISSIATIIEGPSFKDDINEYIKDYNLIIPCMDEATVALSKTKHVGKVVSTEEICVDCLDKQKTYERWGNIIPPVENDLFPKFYRKRKGFGNKGSGVLSNHGEYKKFLKQNNVDDYIFNNYIKDPFEISVDAYVSRKGKFVYLGRSRDEILDGEVVRSSYFELNDELKEKVEMILSSDGFFGPINIQLISTKKGWRLLEINPRFCGGMTMTIASGLNFPQFVMDDYAGVCPFSSLQEIKKIRMCRSRRDHYQYINND